MNEHYYKHLSGDLETFTQAREKERKKKEKEEKKRTVERHFCLIFPVGLILPIF